MLRILNPATPALFLASALMASAAIFPDQVGPFKKGAPTTVAAPDLPLYDEYGVQATEQAEYAAPASDTQPAKKFVATAWRFPDATGALAMFQARRPPKAAKSKVAKLAVTTSDGMIFADGNYLLQLTGSIPAQADLVDMYNQLPEHNHTPLPLLMEELPPDGLIPNSERYILGPVSLQHFYPGIAPSIAAFHLGAEGQVGQYETPKGNLTLAIFNYPTPGFARERYDEFSKIPGAVVKRAGPMVAVIIEPADPDAAERVLAQVRYEANITLNEPPAPTVRQVGGVLLSIFALAGFILGLCLVAGIGFGAFRVMLRKLGWNPEERGAMITLHLGNK